MLLSADVGHFSLVRAMHLADLITLMNGTNPPTSDGYLANCSLSQSVGLSV